MYARSVDEASTRLRELRHEEWEQLGLGALALALAVVATRIEPSLAVPLFLGGLAVGALGVRAMWRHWDLLDRLAIERESYVIAEVRAYATREATMGRRRSFAAMIRALLEEPPGAADRFGDARAELEALASELDDEELTLDPACAVACMRLLTDLETSPLLNATLSSQALRSRVRQIRAGFGAAERAA
jgi:hypothetical protein